MVAYFLRHNGSSWCSFLKEKVQIFEALIDNTRNVLCVPAAHLVQCHRWFDFVKNFFDSCKNNKNNKLINLYTNCVPSLSSVPKITAWLLAIVILWTNEFSLWLVLMRGTMTPSFDRPSQVHMNSGLFSRKRATTSPFLYPWLLKTFAILLLYSST